MNDEIDKLRNAATCALGERDDVIVVSSVSCIYGLGAPEEFFRLGISLRPGQEMARDELLRRLVEIHYTRNDVDFKRSTFRVRWTSWKFFPLPIPKSPSAWNFLATRSTRSARRTSSRARSSLP